VPRRPPPPAALLVAVLLGLACRPNTPRPSYPPVTGAPQAEIELRVRDATQALADVLRSDSLPLTRVEPFDGYLETTWFDTGTRKPSQERRLGAGIVQVRAWVDPTKPGFSRMTVETVYRPLADPSLPPRMLDQEVPPEHPVGKRIATILKELTKLYAREPADSAGG
jgi:hypothetical protein